MDNTTARSPKTLIEAIRHYSNLDTCHAVMVADRNDSNDDFEANSLAVSALLPAGVNVQTINRGTNDTATVRAQIISSLNQGPLVVNYFGHGSVGLWTGSGLLNASDVAALTNGNRVPLVTTMTCLNGFFQDLNGDSLAEAFLKAPQGGAVAVWASSGLTDLNGQAAMDREFYRQLFNEPATPLGDAVWNAKAVTQDESVRRTWILFGDPTMRLR